MFRIRDASDYVRGFFKKKPISKVFCTYFSATQSVAGLLSIFSFSIYMFPVYVNFILWLLIVDDLTIRHTDLQSWIIKWISLPCIYVQSPACLLVFVTWINLYGSDSQFAPSPVMFSFFDSLRQSLIGFANIQFGCNSLFDSYIILTEERFKDIILRLLQNVTLIPMIKATKLRDNGLSANIQRVEDIPLDPELCLVERRMGARKSRVMLLIGSFIFVSIIYFQPLLLLFLYVVFLQLSPDQSSPHIENVKDVSITDGVYRLKKCWLGLTVDSCIGIVYEGVMHSCYHGCGDTDLHIGRRVISPKFYDPELDLITWGGLPSFQCVTPDDDLYVNNERDDGRYTYSVNFKVSGPFLFSWPGKTEPGDSGSPLWLKRGDSLLLVGLAGCWVNNGSVITEFFQSPPSMKEDIPKEIDGIERICKFPGYGKTRRIIPTIVSSELNKKNCKILLLGPTRVVCKEIYDGIKGQFPGQVSLDISDSVELKLNPKIRIMAHSTFLSRCCRSSLSVMKPTCIILDEAHSDMSSTHAIVKMSQYFVDNGSRVIHMSATFPDECDTRSNCNIRDIQIDEVEICDILEKELTSGMKVCLFVPGAKGKYGWERMQKKFDAINAKYGGQYTSVILSRSKYERAMREIRGGVDLIISTNIAECGANLDIDVVIDTCVNYKFVLDGYDVVLDEILINKASMIQRRGRVGRSREGTYYYLSTPHEDSRITAEQLDGEMIASALVSSPSDINFSCSRKQAIVSILKNVSPLVTSLFYTTSGIKRGFQDMKSVVSQWKNGPCKRTCRYSKYFERCKCEGNYQWFDERHHRDLLKLITGMLQEPTQTEDPEYF